MLKPSAADIVWILREARCVSGHRGSKQRAIDLRISNSHSSDSTGVALSRILQ